MKILRYVKRVPLTDWFPGTYQIVPENEVREDASFFDEILEVVKKEGCSYILVEQTETVIERRD